MDYKTSKSRNKVALKIQNIWRGTWGVVFFGCSIFLASYVDVIAQTTNPLSVTISITAEAPSPLILPQTEPNNQPAPLNLVDTRDVIVFRGLAYPRGIVSLLRNGSVIAQSSSQQNGTFEIRLQNLSAGTHTFGIHAIDEERRVSKLLTLTVLITKGVTTFVDGIFLPPTLTSDKEEVKVGNTIIFSGRSAPLLEVRLSIKGNSEILKKTTSNAAGLWSFTLSTEGFSFGSYEVKSRAVSIVDTSPYGDNLSFIVSNVDKIRKKSSVLSGIRKRCDLNDDNRVNLLDFSIMAFWYKRLGFPDKVDLNVDTKVNLTDLSILAYCWTG